MRWALVAGSIIVTLFAAAIAWRMWPPVQTDFCAMAERPLLFVGRQVRTQALGLFSHHGAYLAHHECRTRTVAWHETRRFRTDPSNDLLGDAIWRAMWEEGLDPRNVAVDVTGIAGIEWTIRSGRLRLVIEVDKVHSATSAEPVYPSDRERDEIRCFMGTLIERQGSGERYRVEIKQACDAWLSAGTPKQQQEAKELLQVWRSRDRQR